MKRFAAAAGLALSLVALIPKPVTARDAAPIVFVPLDDRPVTYQLPVMLGEIAGRNVIATPRSLIGSYLRFGEPDRIIAWLNHQTTGASAYVVSSDMLAYGGLTASRVPGVSYSDAYFRINELRTIRRRDPSAWLGVFGTVMRLAPTGVPAIGDAASFFAAYPIWTYLQQYANLHDPPLTSEEATAQHLRELAGPALQAYLDTRARNLALDKLLLESARNRTIDRLVLGQDDAGPVGLHVPEVAQLQAIVRDESLEDRVSIEPGADELGMALVANALSRAAHWTPHVSVVYSTPSGGTYQDPLEFAPISTTIESLIALCGGVRDDAHPDLVLYVRVPRTPQAFDDTFVADMQQRITAGKSVAFADLSYEASYASQETFAQRLLASGVASQLDAYSSWNTTANTVGTALAEAIAAGAGRRSGTYNALAHKTFTYVRFADDVLFHDEVRPDLNSWLAAQGVQDHTYLLPDVAATTAERNNGLLWGRAQALLQTLYPNFHIAAMNISLPWQRTFETEIDVRLAPNL